MMYLLKRRQEYHQGMMRMDKIIAAFVRRDYEPRTFVSAIDGCEYTTTARKDDPTLAR